MTTEANKFWAGVLQIVALGDEERKLYREWVELAEDMQEKRHMPNGMKANILETKIELNLTAYLGHQPKEREIMLAFYVVLNEIHGEFEPNDESEEPSAS